VKTLYLVRHGKAEAGNMETPDYERALAERGVQDSVMMGGLLRNHGIKPSLLISSPASRALATAKIFAGELGYPKKRIRTRKAMYEQQEDVLAEVARSVGDEYDDVMLVGHNPSMEEFARFLVEDFTAAIPTCGVVGIECGIDSWRELSKGKGKLLFFESPKSSPKPLKKKILRKTVGGSLARRMEEVLSGFDPDAAARMKKTVKTVCDELARKFVGKMKKPAG